MFKGSVGDSIGEILTEQKLFFLIFFFFFFADFFCEKNFDTAECPKVIAISAISYL
jgi:hypothetical protein